MKKTIIAISMFPLCATLAQTNWTFQWHGQERGLIFAQTNLSENVKAAIRDDIAQVMSNIAVSDTEIYPVRPNHPDHGTVDGLLNIRSHRHTYSDDFPIGYYREINGVPYFLLSEEGCSSYVTAIGLTNSASAKIAKLPAVIVPFTNGFDIANMTIKQKRGVIWNPTLQKKFGNDDKTFKEIFDESMPRIPGQLRFLPPSVLSYKMEQLEDEGDTLLTCTVLGESFFFGERKPEKALFVYIKGNWRFCPPVF